MQFYPLRLTGDHSKFHFMKYRKAFMSFSLAISLISIILLFSARLNFGIDFTGGIVIEAKSTKELNIAQIRSTLHSLDDIGEISIQNFGDKNNFAIRVGANAKGDISKTITLIKRTLIDKISEDIEFRKTDFVGPQVGTQLMVSGAQALILSFLGIMIYIWVRFEWQFGIGVLVSLLHDIIVALGFLSITQLDFNLSSIAALLTIIGYSVNDSVVIYDRIRENLRKYKNKSIDEIIDLSINETLSRTTLTILTTLIANLALIIWGGESIRSFSILVFFGIAVGTYSSICISAPILKLFGLERFK